MKQIQLAVTFVTTVFVLSPFTAVSDSPPLSKKELESLASHIFAGVVQQTYVRSQQQGDYLYEYGVVEVDVKRVDKGSDIAVKDRAFVKFWKKAWTGDKQNPPPDDTGQLAIPRKGDAVQIFASGDNKTGFEALSPNGFTKDELRVATETRSDDGHAQATADGPGQENAALQRTIELQRITALSSSQFYTHFALIRIMLNGEWDDETFQKFSWYDGVNLNMMRGYEKRLKDNKKWGPFLKMKNALHQQVYDDLMPLIRKKRRGEELTDADDEKLEDLDKQIFDRLIK